MGLKKRRNKEKTTQESVGERQKMRRYELYECQ